jgi:transcriptional accessory protein Tex/SPT6
MSKLDLFNPLNSSSVNQPSNEDFHSNISQQIEDVNNLREKNQEIMDFIEEQGNLIEE